MIAAEDIIVDFGGDDFIAESVGNDKIIYAPACVFGAGLEHVAPPGVFYGVGIHIAEGIRKSAFKKLRHFPSFLIGEARITHV